LKTFREAVQSEHFSLTAELTVKRDSSADDIRRQADVLGNYVDAVQVTDNPYAWVQMSALSAAGILIEQGIDPLPILTCRDRNRIALQCELLGLQALGVTSLLLMRGPRVPKDHSVPASTVFDLSGRELVALASSLSEEHEVGHGKGFFIGAAARAFRPKPSWRAESLLEKSEAGAKFIQTQLCFNMDLLRNYMRGFLELKMDRRYSVIVTLSPLPSAVTAKWLKNTMTDSRIPAEVISRLEEAKNPEREGMRICVELMHEVSEIPGVSGINLMTTGDPEAIASTIQCSEMRD
jgi:methylenetetrahydrofolate reductase (NADPH)